MGKGIKGLSYLPKINIFNVVGENASLRAYRDVLYKIQEMQADEQNNTTLTAEELKSNQPYYNSVWDIIAAPALAAGADVTMATALAGDTVTINGLLYTGVAGVKSDNTEFSIDTSNTATALDLADSINNDTRDGTFGDVEATPAAAVVTLKQSVLGSDGNATTLASSNGTRIVISGSTFTGGLNDTYITTFISENNIEIESINTPGLTTKRPLDIAFAGDIFPFTVRSVLSVLRWIEDPIEVKASSIGAETSTDGTYTNAIFRGATPYETYTWTVVKLGNVYTLTSTAES